MIKPQIGRQFLISWLMRLGNILNHFSQEERTMKNWKKKYGIGNNKNSILIVWKIIIDRDPNPKQLKKQEELIAIETYATTQIGLYYARLLLKYTGIRCETQKQRKTNIDQAQEWLNERRFHDALFWFIVYSASVSLPKADFSTICYETGRSVFQGQYVLS